MEKHLKPDEASRLDKTLALIRKAVIASKTSKFYDVDVYVTCHGYVDFVISRKRSTNSLFSITIAHKNETSFHEEYPSLNNKLNILVNKPDFLF